MRRTKIVATLGPASDRPGVLEKMIAAGVDVVRLNLSHGEPGEYHRRVHAARAAAEAQGRDIGVLMDLAGPKIRIEGFQSPQVHLETGAGFVLDSSLDAEAGTEQAVGVSYQPLAQEMSPGDELILGDGEVTLQVRRVEGPRVYCRVLTGGTLSAHKGLNRRGGGLAAATLTAKDRADLHLAAELQTDYLSVSFPRCAEDIEQARALLREAGGEGAIVAKIERAEAVDSLESIVRASDAVMVARGDLAVEIGDAYLPGVQKRVIRYAREHNTLVITATQMMESMVSSPVPTRAEVLDVANAVLDGTDAVMLSEETAVGAYPVRVVEAMAGICAGAETEPDIYQVGRFSVTSVSRIDEAVAAASIYLANQVGIRALVALTETGRTALFLSRGRADIPIYALTAHERTRRQLCLCRGVTPLCFPEASDSETLLQEVVSLLLERGAVGADDVILVTRGMLRGKVGGTNTLHVVRVRDLQHDEGGISLPSSGKPSGKLL